MYSITSKKEIIGNTCPIYNIRKMLLSNINS